MKTPRFALQVATVLLVGSWVFEPPAVGAQIIVDGTLVPRTPLAGPDFVIDPSLGKIHGRNLFHSFEQFNVLRGESATFTGPEGIGNIISRVTGGQQSTIDGLLRSTIDGANFFLLNPNGVFFGANATLDVKGSVHVSTGDFIRFADGTVFSADAARPTVLSVAEPAAFGFLGVGPGVIEVQDARLLVPASATLTLAGGAITLAGATLGTSGGRVQMASVASAGEVVLAGSGSPERFSVSGVAELGRIELGGSLIDVRGDPGGIVVIRGGRLVMERSNVTAATTGSADHPGLAVDIDVAGSMSVAAASEIAASSTSTGDAGDIRIAAGALEVVADLATGFGSNIGSRAFSAGAAGDVAIQTDSLFLHGAAINTPSLAAGRGGNVIIHAGRIELVGERGPAFIASGAFGTGDSGNVDVHAGDVLVRGGPGGFAGFATQVSTTAMGGVQAGRLRIEADTLTLLDGGQLSSGSFAGPGAGGDIEVVAGRISVSGTNPFGFRAGIFATVEGPSATGTAGSIHVRAGQLELANRGSISASAFFGSPGDAGNVTVDAGAIDIRAGASISSSSLFGTGDAGNVRITTDRLHMTGVAGSPDPFITDFTGVSTTTNAGVGGELRITARDVVVRDKATITSLSVGPGAGGAIHLDLPGGTLLVDSGGTIASSAFGSGPGGTIRGIAAHITVAGAGRFNGPTDSGLSAVASQAGLGGGRAGNIELTTDNLRVLDGGKVTTETFGAGDGGNIDVTAARVLVSGVDEGMRARLAGVPGADTTAASAAITANSSGFFLGVAATGAAGNVRIAAGTIDVAAGGAISSKTDTVGAGGRVDLSADRVTLTDGAVVSTQSTGAAGGRGGDIVITARDTVSMTAAALSTSAEEGTGGSIAVSAGQLDLCPGAVVSASSSGAGNAGSLSLVAASVLRGEGAVVTTDAVQADGGNIDIQAGSLVHFRDSEVTTSVQNGQGAGGNISIDPDFVVLDGTRIRADAFGGPGGNVRIVTDVFLPSDSLVSALLFWMISLLLSLLFLFKFQGLLFL
jgi:filamentous hemagglutinin family protein